MKNANSTRYHLRNNRVRNYDFERFKAALSKVNNKAFFTKNTQTNEF